MTPSPPGIRELLAQCGARPTRDPSLWLHWLCAKSSALRQEEPILYMHAEGGSEVPLGRSLNLLSGSRQIFLHRSDTHDSWMNGFDEWFHSWADPIILSAQSYATEIVSSGLIKIKADDLTSCFKCIHRNPWLLPFPTSLTPAQNVIDLWILFHWRLATGAWGPEGLLSPHVFPELILIDSNTWLGIIVSA